MAKTSSVNPTDAEMQLLVQIWSKAVDTQMHFNEMSVKSRQLGLTFVAAALGVAVFLLSKDQEFEFQIWNFTIHASVLIIFAAAASVWVVRGLDLGVYHKMLRGAVAFGEDFEQHYMSRIFDLEKGMTQAISHFSRYEDAKVLAEPIGSRYKYQGSCRRSAEIKIKRFYRWTIILLTLAALILLCITNVEFAKKSWTTKAAPKESTQINLPEVQPGIPVVEPEKPAVEPEK